jgi:hypothetical protein
MPAADFLRTRSPFITDTLDIAAPRSLSKPIKPSKSKICAENVSVIEEG